MPEIIFKYGSYHLGSLTWGTDKSMDALRITENPENKKITGSDLRDEHYSHLVSTRTNTEVVISADELITDENYNFLIDFYNAEVGCISYFGNCNIIVDTEGGKFPWEAIENCNDLKEVKLDLIQKEPD